MKISPVTMSVVDYCGFMERGEVRIDKTYQRSSEIWPERARSYLIETILKGFPIPKFALHQETDLQSRKTVKKVVDGQQRTMAIQDFYHDELRLSRRLGLKEAAGRVYSELDAELKNAFLTYILTIDQFESSPDEVVREYFRRINSFTAPLNAEELRHAQFQGQMKWFIVEMRQRYGDRFVDLKVLPRKSVVRMADSKLLAEVVHALLYGIQTTTKTKLDKMYGEFEKNESELDETAIRSAIDVAFDRILSWRDIHGSSLMRTHVFYSLLLAVIRVDVGWDTLDGVPGPDSAVTPTRGAVRGLLSLAAALDEPEEHPTYVEWVEASEKGTNVGDARAKRVRWLVRALIA